MTGRAPAVHLVIARASLPELHRARRERLKSRFHQIAGNAIDSAQITYCGEWAPSIVAGRAVPLPARWTFDPDNFSCQRCRRAFDGNPFKPAPK